MVLKFAGNGLEMAVSLWCWKGHTVFVDILNRGHLSAVFILGKYYVLKL